jgi:hypothetical protein
LHIFLRGIMRRCIAGFEYQRYKMGEVRIKENVRFEGTFGKQFTFYKLH